MPEILWKAYVDFEVDEQGDREKARSLYERLISLSGHHKVWISYAEFEGSSIPLPRAMREEEEENEDVEPRVVAGDPILAWQVFERGYKDLRSKGLKAEVRLRRSGSSEQVMNLGVRSGLLYSRHGRHSRRPMVLRPMWLRCKP